MMQEVRIRIDVVSDVACPWCYIGKHRLENAIRQWKGGAIEVNWHPYLLNPGIPKEGQNRSTYLMQKFGTVTRPEAMNRIHTAAKGVGLELNFGENWLAVDTLPLHKLMHVAGQAGFKAELKERFFYAYFTENLHLNEVSILEKIMSEFGWDKEKTKGVLSDNIVEEEVKAQIEYYRENGVSGVPFFIVDNKYGFSGAQEQETFLKIFARAWEENNAN